MCGWWFHIRDASRPSMLMAEAGAGASAERLADAVEGGFWTLFERSWNAIVLLDEQRRIVDLNPAAERLLGLVKSESLGRSIVELISVPERARASVEWQELLGSALFSSTCTMVMRGGAEINVNFAASL